MPLRPFHRRGKRGPPAQRVEQRHGRCSLDITAQFWCILKMRFDWDTQKAAANLVKHGISFEEAVTAFDDPFALVAPDFIHSVGEERRWLIGTGDRGVLVVIFTVRQPGSVYRVISARPASRRERRRYEEARRVPL